MTGVKLDVWLYLIGGGDGSIKVGQSSNPRKRLSTHRRDTNYLWAHVFGPKSGLAESLCLLGLAKVGRRRYRREIFDGVSKQVAIEICREQINRTRRQLERYRQKS